MCGRYTLKHLPEEILETFEAIQDIAIDPPPPSWNIAPTQLAPVVGVRDGQRVLRVMRWGLIPAWSKDDKIGAKCVNARGETAHEKPAFRSAFVRRRCVVPASGWYEWSSAGGAKTPWYFSAHDGGLLALAGLWERWIAPDQSEVRTFSVVTCPPNAAVSPLHDRMPVVLDRAGISLWLNTETPAAELHALIAPSPAERLVAWEVDRRVGAPRVNDASLIAPIAREGRAA